MTVVTVGQRDSKCKDLYTFKGDSSKRTDTDGEGCKTRDGSGEDSVFEQCERSSKKTGEWMGKRRRMLLPDREKLMSLLLPSPWLTSGLTTGFKTCRHRQTRGVKNCPQMKQT